VSLSIPVILSLIHYGYPGYGALMENEFSRFDVSYLRPDSHLVGSPIL